MLHIYVLHKYMVYEISVFCTQDTSFPNPMRKIILFISGLLLFAFCTRNEISPVAVPCTPQIPSNHRLVREDNYSGPDTVFTQGAEYVYDSSGRLKYEITSTSWGGPMDTVMYAYSGNRVLAWAGNQGYDYTGYDLNGQGFAVSCFNYHLVFWERSYNPDGYVTQHRTVNPYANTATDCYYSCFNLNVQIIQSQETSGVRYDTIWYEYYPNKSNTIGNENRGLAFFGKQDNLLLKSVRSTNDSPYSYTYVFDSLDRVKWRIMKNAQGTETFTKYTYL
jgi:hypothetical protein